MSISSKIIGLALGATFFAATGIGLAHADTAKIETTSYMMHIKEIGPSAGIGRDRPAIKTAFDDDMSGMDMGIGPGGFSR